jgi:hypothetical protein
MGTTVSHFEYAQGGRFNIYGGDINNDGSVKMI